MNDYSYQLKVTQLIGRTTGRWETYRTPKPLKKGQWVLVAEPNKPLVTSHILVLAVDSEARAMGQIAYATALGLELFLN